MLIKGVVLKVQRMTGQRDGRSWDYLQCHVLDDVEVYRARVADDYPQPLPIEGEEGIWEVEVQAYKRGDNGAAELGLRLKRPADLTGASRADRS